jgi:hypothetical protein
MLNTASLLLHLAQGEELNSREVTPPVKLAEVKESPSETNAQNSRPKSFANSLAGGKEIRFMDQNFLLPPTRRLTDIYPKTFNDPTALRGHRFWDYAVAVAALLGA